MIDKSRTISSFFRVLVLKTVALMLLPLTPVAAFKEPLTAGVFYEHPPYSSSSNDGQIRGLLVDYYNAMHQEQSPLQFVGIPYERLIHNLIEGKIHTAMVLMIPGELDIPTVDSLIVSDRAILTVPMFLFVDEQRLKDLMLPEHFSVIPDLHYLRVGFLRSGSSKIHTTLHSQRNITFFNRYGNMIKSLISGRIDIAGVDVLTAKYWEQNLTVRLSKQYRLIDAPIHLAFSKKALLNDTVGLCQRYLTNLYLQRHSGQLNTALSTHKDTSLMQYIASEISLSKTHCVALNEIDKTPPPALEFPKLR